MTDAEQTQSTTIRRSRAPSARARRRADARGAPDRAAARADGPSADPTGGPQAPVGWPAAVRSARRRRDALQGDLDELVAVAAQRDEYLALAQRTQADFENYRKRVAREAAAAQERGVASSPRSCCRRSTTSTARWSAARPRTTRCSTGVRLVRSRAAAAALAARRHRVVLAAGEAFDPSCTRRGASSRADGRRAGTVVEVYQAGYRLGASVIRPARVVVAALGAATMAARPDYYTTLGVDKKATRRGDQEGLPQARAPVPPRPQPRRQAAEARFKEISQAHDVLGDPEKRKQYDSGSGPFATGAGPGGGFGGFGNFDFDALLDGRHPLEPVRRLDAAAGACARKPRAGARRATSRPGVDHLRPGGRRRAGAAAVPMHATCPTCRGTGAKPGTTPIVCPRCEGRGIETQGQGMFSISQPCSRCGGAGTVIEDPCPTCHGTRRRAHASSGCA